ncbi:protein AF-9 [Ceratina calcarata]|uniref:Protein AF-9 n=1 Tax=Ceratina calcarata TaxID=156304 RepID=A0AAJ7J2T6_9HYME|nr:protein AF-9 [Ceratina calcarata]
MAIRIALECGHTSMLRMRPTPEGYTHDWEVFVRGMDNADIHHYVEKVVFQLHETFPKPKKILKDPPFVIKQSGYAGFEIPIHIYLKNKDDGNKRIEILYDLNLQTSGPAYTNVIKHIETISNPSDEFRRKLLKGGGIPVSTSEYSSEKSETKTPTMVSKPKLSGSDSKRHKNVESKTSNSFAELFGTPLKPTKVSQDTKKLTQPERSSASKSSVTTEKSDKVDKAKLKDSPHKDGKKEKLDDKKDKKIKDQSKDKTRSKEKSKRPPSPGNRSHSSPSNKRPLSPPAIPVKKPPSPLPPPKRSASPKPKDKELKKVPAEKEKEKSKEKVKDSSKNIADSSKSEKKKDKKKHKEDRDKERKDKYKDGEQSSSKEPMKVTEKKNDKPEKSERAEKEKNQEYKSTKDGRKSPKPQKESEKPKDDKLLKIEKSEKTEKTDKTKDGKTEKDRQKHKHKKRDKKDKRDSSKDRERKEKRERIKSSVDKQNNVPNASVANPLSALLAEIPERDSSDSAPSVDEDSYSESKLVPTIKKETENLTVSTPPTEMAKPLSPAMPMMDIKKEKVERIKREKPKGSKGEEKETRKRKRKSDSKLDDEPAIKREKDRGHSTSPTLEPVSSSQSPVVVDQEMVHVKEERSVKEGQIIEKNVEVEAEQVAPDSTNSTLVDSDMGEPPVFSEDYVSQLKDLQQKIMTLQDNEELQRVVQVIAETGQYEITKKTFDFDLCALDRRTVQRLQQFFAS